MREPRGDGIANSCSLCGGGQLEDFWRDERRNYIRCTRCALIFVPARYHVSASEERAEYDLHENDSSDPGYRQFLGRLVQPLLARLVPGARGLDFGCGPGPTLSIMLDEAGFAMDVYDVFYANDRQIFERRYNFITATEVVEHFANPQFELERLYQMLEPGGMLAVMTKLALGKDAFANWHYKNDKTHVAFFSRETFAWLARQLGSTLEFLAADVIFLTKPTG